MSPRTNGRRTNHRRLRRVAIAAAFSATLAAGCAGTASANQMTVYSCHDPAGTAVGHGGWAIQRTSDEDMAIVDSCANGGAGAMSLNLGANGSGYANAARVEWVFAAPSWGSIAQYDVQIADSYAIPSTGGGSGQVFVDASDESDPLYDYRNLGGGSWGETTISRTPPTAVSTVVLNASCDGQDGPCAANAEVSHLDVTSTELLLDDFTTPTVNSVGGTLTSTAPIEGTGEINFNASDDGPGIYSAWLIIDGHAQPSVLVNSNNGLCQNLGEPTNGTRAFATPEPCAKSTTGSVSLNTASLSDGAHTVKLLVDDAGGNTTTAYSGTITVHNDSASSLGATPGPGTGGGRPNGLGARPSARLTLGSRRSVTRTYRHRAMTVAGRLLSSTGVPISGARLDVLQQVEGAASASVVAHATTSATGTFAVRVPPGPSRVLEVTYRAFSAEAKYAAVARVRETVDAGVRLSIAPARTGPEGQIALSGKVSGPIPAQGAIVDLLVHYRGHWEPFRTPRTDREGRFRVNYQFEGGVGHFPFRAVVPGGQSGFPFAAGNSQVVDVST